MRPHPHAPELVWVPTGLGWDGSGSRLAGGSYVRSLFQTHEHADVVGGSVQTNCGRNVSMLHLDGGIVVLFLIAFFAAFVNGALGYGFSSLTVPFALLFFSNRVLSPALVLVELAVNAWVVILNRGSLAAVRRRAIPI